MYPLRKAMSNAFLPKESNLFCILKDIVFHLGSLSILGDGS